MIILYIATSLLLALIAYQLSGSFRIRRHRNRVASAEAAGIELDASGNVHACNTYATLSEIEKYSGERFSGKQADFMELTRLIVVSVNPSLKQTAIFSPVLRKIALSGRWVSKTKSMNKVA